MTSGWNCIAGALLATACLVGGGRAQGEPLGTEGFVDADGVKLHYVTAGQGPLVVLIHGFPDFWYTWRRQMPALAERYQVVAYDQRGYNLSDQPVGVDDYRVEKLVADLEAVVDHFGAERATVVGHDWGGLVAWTFAMQRPERVERLAILNLPHPRGLLRELANNPWQQLASGYARAFQEPDAAAKLSPEALASWVDAEARPKYVEAFKRSSLEGMLHYYRANYPRPPYEVPEDLPQVKCPVLMIHGLKDVALLPGALNDTWQWVDNELTLVTLPRAGHFVQHDAADEVTRNLLGWLRQQTPEPHP
jgi:pimeloyl-ACP methyl ester carboxylesterase